MKTTLIMLQIGAWVALGVDANAGPSEFIREQLAVPAAFVQFDAAPSAIPNIRRVRSIPGEEEWHSKGPLEGFTNEWLGFSFTSNKLDAVTVRTKGKERNEKLIAELARVSGIAADKLPWQWGEGAYRLTYQALNENESVSFRLTTTAGEVRQQKAKAARLAGPPYFVFGGWNASMADGKYNEIILYMANGGGPASRLAVHPSAGVAVRVERVETENSRDEHYKLTCKPTGSPALPESWRFSMTYLDGNQKRQERYYKVAQTEVTETNDRDSN